MKRDAVDISLRDVSTVSPKLAFLEGKTVRVSLNGSLSFEVECTTHECSELLKAVSDSACGDALAVFVSKHFAHAQSEPDDVFADRLVAVDVKASRYQISTRRQEMLKLPEAVYMAFCPDTRIAAASWTDMQERFRTCVNEHLTQLGLHVLDQCSYDIRCVSPSECGLKLDTLRPVTWDAAQWSTAISSRIRPLLLEDKLVLDEDSNTIRATSTSLFVLISRDVQVLEIVCKSMERVLGCKVQDTVSILEPAPDAPDPVPDVNDTPLNSSPPSKKACASTDDHPSCVDSVEEYAVARLGHHPCLREALKSVVSWRPRDGDVDTATTAFLESLHAVYQQQPSLFVREGEGCSGNRAKTPSELACMLHGMGLVHNGNVSKAFEALVAWCGSCSGDASMLSDVTQTLLLGIKWRLESDLMFAFILNRMQDDVISEPHSGHEILEEFEKTRSILDDEKVFELLEFSFQRIHHRHTPSWFSELRDFAMSMNEEKALGTII